MNMTKEGLALIRRFEGFRGKAYKDAVGVWTVGYGHTSLAGSPTVAGGLEISRQEAARILGSDVEKFAKGVASLLKRELTDNQFSALVSFAFNVGLGNFGASSVLKAINAGDLASVPRRLQLWTKAGGRMLPGLVTRRAAEAELFLGSDGKKAPPERPKGKPLLKSTTNIAALISALAGVASTVIGTANEAAGVFGKGAPVVLLAVIVLAALWIIRERRKKAVEEGV